MEEADCERLPVVRGKEEGETSHQPDHKTHSIEDRSVLETEGEVHLVMEGRGSTARPTATAAAGVDLPFLLCVFCVCTYLAS